MEILGVTYPLLWVRWLDHMTDDDWSQTPIQEPPVLQTVGWLVREDERTLTLVQCVDEKHSDFCMQFLILKSCIVDRKEITNVSTNPG